MKIMVYSHDTYGLGNISRMLTICQYLLEEIPKLSILLVCSSPVVHCFRMPKGLDYIKLPCIARNELGELAVKYLEMEKEEMLKLRSDLIKVTAINFKPDIILVDKKPFGLQEELRDTLEQIKIYDYSSKVVLLLRDILDSPEKIIPEWKTKGYYEGIELFYDQVWVVGMQEIFDIIKEYKFPPTISGKVKHCGYIRRRAEGKNRQEIRQELNLNSEEQFVLVTPGGGADGYHLIDNYISGLNHLPKEYKIRSLITFGPEMTQEKQQALYRKAKQYSHLKFIEFTDELTSYINAADAIVSMGGYNTICEILSLEKPAVIVPRVKPVKEQLIRAEFMDKLGLIKTIHPDLLNPKNLISAVVKQLSNADKNQSKLFNLDLDALPRIVDLIDKLLHKKEGRIKKEEGGIKIDKSIDKYSLVKDFFGEERGGLTSYTTFKKECTSFSSS
ncbi:glycosyltransferase [Okeania sp.]|uniref:glycosyltransferase family protein n=1 Tax=Okeania sp. TaxID=3100323 RepID=UPI002B4B24B2|nr:glycosyltransferase [Okeania sp.]MEB3342877.1 glycosyltransferase [Okeania sp.]